MPDEPAPFGRFRFVLDERIRSAGMNPTQFARKLGYANSGGVFLVLQGKKSAPLDKLDEWFDVLGVDGNDRRNLWLRALEDYAPPYVLRLINEMRFEWRKTADLLVAAMRAGGINPPPVPDLYGQRPAKPAAPAAAPGKPASK